MGDMWYVAGQDGKQYGPYSAEVLLKFSTEGKVLPDTQVWSDGMPGWLPFKQAFKAVGPPPPPLRMPAYSNTSSATNTVKAVCSCTGMSELDPVVACERERFYFMEEWGCFTVLMALFLMLATGGSWAIAIIGWNLSSILNPKYYCNRCKVTIPPNQFRA